MKAVRQERSAAIVLAAGSGSRMGSETKKQYMQIGGKPVIYYSLRAFEESQVQEIFLVVSPGDTAYCQKEIVEKYGFKKVRRIVEGGKERYHSVAIGLKQTSDCDYVFIHDGARPLVTEEIIERALCGVRKHKACVVGMPVKDTIKIANRDQFAVETPERSFVWQVQTPQVFSYDLINRAYKRLIEREEQGERISVTDDAMVLETILNKQVYLVEGAYKNIKITTPEDLEMAEIFLKNG